MYTPEQLFVAISTPFYACIILAEILFSAYHQTERYTLKDTAQNIYLTLLNASLDVGVRFLFYGSIMIFLYNHKIATIQNAILYWVVLVLLEDFLYYWLHRADHTIRFFWAMHVTHHSSEKYNLSTGFRSSVFEPMYRFIFFAPIPLLGFKPEHIYLSYAMTQIWGILVHTQAINKLGFLEYFLVTPSHHRVHHASNPLYLDKNMGMFLIVWDKMFGTFQQELLDENYQKIKYGLTTPTNLNNPIFLVFHEWVAIFKDAFQPKINLKQRWNYIFGPPGYSHNGSRQTSIEMRAQEKNKSTNTRFKK